MSKNQKLTTFDPESVDWVDLGLPSGLLWAAENAPGHYTFDEAVATFCECLPKGAAMVELFEECQVDWNPEKKGLDITGPNGNSIFLRAAGYIDCDTQELVAAGRLGEYWTRMPYLPHTKSFAPHSQAGARGLGFGSGYVYPLDFDGRAYGFSVRPSREY